MKRKQHPVIGRTVMVHPYLTTDPVKKQGEVGEVTGVAGKTGDILTVKFGDGSTGRYLPDALLTLAPKTVIMQGLLSNEDMPGAEYREIMKIYQLITLKQQAVALKLALTSDSAKFFCTTTCAEWIEMKQQQNNIKQGPKL